MMSKGKLRNINVKGVEWKYIIEHDIDRKAEVRIYNPSTKQIIKRVEFSELGFGEYEIEHGGCNITPKIIREYIQDNWCYYSGMPSPSAYSNDDLENMD